MLSDVLKTKIKLHAIDSFPYECCGFVLEDDVYVILENKHDEPDKHFLIDGSDFIKYEERIKCIVHSHTFKDGQQLSNAPSKNDMAQQMNHTIPWCIVATDGNCASEPNVFGWNIIREDHIGRQFIHGSSDCYSLIRDWYFHNKNILLPEFPREDKWWSNSDCADSMYHDCFEAGGFKFKQFNINNLKVGDLLLLRMGSRDKLNHAMLYEGNGIISHHLWNRLSTKEPLINWKDRVEGVLEYVNTSPLAWDTKELCEDVVII